MTKPRTNPPPHDRRKVVAIVSGGMDSTVLAHDLAANPFVDFVGMLSVDYGQRHSTELDYAAATAAELGVPHEVADLRGVTRLLGGSALTDDIDVPHGHYAEDSMRITVVPNRNAIMLSVAAGWAVSLGADTVATAVHAGDHFVYPDCRPDFIRAISHAFELGTESFGDIIVWAPYVDISKTDIARIGGKLDVDFTKTWSCYEGNDTHCGQCGTCVERKEAIGDAGLDDPTEYLA